MAAQSPRTAVWRKIGFCQATCHTLGTLAPIEDMAHFIIFERTQQLSNVIALENNKAEAARMLKKFSDLRACSEFVTFQIDNNAEYPDKHFMMDFSSDDVGILMIFWRNEIVLEMSGGLNTTNLFAQIAQYATHIASSGFQITHPVENETVSLELGLKAHMEAYAGLNTQIEHVRSLIKKDANKL